MCHEDPEPLARLSQSRESSRGLAVGPSGVIAPGGLREVRWCIRALVGVVNCFVVGVCTLPTNATTKQSRGLRRARYLNP